MNAIAHVNPGRQDMLRIFLREGGISRNDIADLLGVHPQSVSRILNGDRALPEHVLRLRELGIPAELLPIPERIAPGPKPRGECGASGATGQAVAGAA
ncbi:helix-turn-helix transcriptional regulator [Nitratidesulfovibrio sp. 1201_IL3209]|uniref:helix-turn-helix transcriptional regulator n=1 Tax=Nitratidesulfovibrio sp. 1201_IL3209 TaxID=3084053 RepID=UPI002FD96298